MRTTEEILSLINNSYTVWKEAGWEWSPSSWEETEIWEEETGVAWEEIIKLEGLMTGYLWCTEGYWCGPRKMVVRHGDGWEEEYWYGEEERDELFASMGAIIGKVSYGASYREASWEVRSVPKGAMEAYEAWTGRRERFQNLSKGWRRFMESLQEEEAGLLLKRWEALPSEDFHGVGGGERKAWREIEGDLVNHPRKTKGWEQKLLELMLLEPSTAWEDDSFGWVGFLGIKKAWGLLDVAPSVWEAADLVYEIWGIKGQHEVEVRIPSSWERAVEYRRKLVQKYQGWDPGDDVELPPPPELLRVEEVEVRVITSTSQLLELGREYNNCLRTVVGKVLSGALLVWEVADQESGERALLGAERKEKEWECGDALFRGINDAEVKSQQLWEQRKAALDTLNAQ